MCSCNLKRSISLVPLKEKKKKKKEPKNPTHSNNKVQWCMFKFSKLNII